MKKTYTITLTHQQLRILEDALNLHSRLSIGQLEVVADFIDKQFHKLMKDQSPWDYKEKYLDPYKQEAFNLPPGASFGIASDQTPVSGKIAYEMQKLIQNEIAKSEQITGTVMSQTPLTVSGTPFIKVTPNE